MTTDHIKSEDLVWILSFPGIYSFQATLLSEEAGGYLNFNLFCQEQNAAGLKKDVLTAVKALMANHAEAAPPHPHPNVSPRGAALGQHRNDQTGHWIDKRC